MYIEKPLDPQKETEIILNDYQFPALNFEYNVNVKLITSDNEVLSKSQKFTYFYHKKDFKILLNTDSIKLWYEKNGVEDQKKVSVNRVDNFGNKTLVFY